MKKTLKYRPEIDGLRAFAVFFVIFFHLDAGFFPGGYIGVDIFFVISGYLITSLILTELNQKNFSLIDFYERRIRRIIPVLFFIIIVSSCFFLFILKPIELISFGKSLIANIFFISNILFWREGGYFDIVNDLKPLFHTWSLGIEEQFYLLFPIFLILLWKIGKFKISLILIFFFLVSFFISELLVKIKPIFSFYMLPTRGWELLAGSLSAFYLQIKTIKKENILVNNLLSLTGFIMIVISTVIFNESTPTPSKHILLPIIGTVLIIVFSKKNTILTNILKIKFFVYLGLMSFSLYLWHQPLIVFAKSISVLSHDLFYTIFFLLLFVFSYLSWKYIEKPFRKKNNKSRKVLFSYCIFSGFLIFSLGIIILIKDGNLWKYNDFQMKLFNNKSHNIYVWKKFHELENKKFDEKAEIKILIIGDSNSGDLTNIIYQDQIIDKNFSVRTFNIPSPCLNLDVDNIKLLIEKKWLKRCEKIDWYNNNKLKELIRNSSLVFLASNWNYNHKELILKSYNNLKIKYGDKFIIFGQKKVDFNLDVILGLNEKNLKKFKVSPDSKAYELNNFLKINIKKFINPYDYICSKNSCDIFDDEKNILVYDGFHLTPEGTFFISKKMKKTLKQYFSK